MSDLEITKSFRDDAQVMAMVKEFKLDCFWLIPWHGGKGRWRVVGTISGRDITENDSLNRAIRECVARMQRSD